MRRKLDSGGCGKSHQAKYGSDIGDVRKYFHSVDIRGGFSVGFYGCVERLGGPQEWCVGMRMTSVSE